jgi:hypothetical protein
LDEPGTGAQDPVGALAERLRALRMLAGNPSVNRLVDLTEKQGRGRAMRRSTIQDKLCGATAPKLDHVLALVAACAAHAASIGNPLSAQELDEDRWQQAWFAMVQTLAGPRRQRHRATRAEAVLASAEKAGARPPGSSAAFAPAPHEGPPDPSHDRPGDDHTVVQDTVHRLPDGTHAPLMQRAGDLARQAQKAEFERGFRDAVEFAAELSWRDFEDLARVDFDVPKWIGPSRDAWAEITMHPDRFPRGATHASWLPAARSSLGSLADPFGYSEFSFTRTNLYVKGFALALRTAWQQATNAAMPTTGEAAAVSPSPRGVDTPPVGEAAARLVELLHGHGGLPLDQVEEIGGQLLRQLRDAFERHMSGVGLPDNARLSLDLMHADSCTYWDRPYRPIHGHGPTALKVQATMTGTVEARSEVTPFLGISRDRDADDAFIVIDANRSTVEPLRLHVSDLYPTITNEIAGRIDQWVAARVNDLLGTLEVGVRQALIQRGYHL